MSELDPWIEGYLNYLTDVKRLAEGSVRDIRCTLNKVSQFMSGQHPGVPLWRLDLDAYISWLTAMREAGRSDQSLKKDASHLRGLLNYSWRSGRADRNVLDGFDIKDAQERTPPRVLTIEEARKLIEACESATFPERRERVVVLLLYGCGLRTSELMNLDVPDVDLERREVFVKKGKGDIQRRVPVPPAVWTELLAYLAERGGKRGPLFRTDVKKKRITSTILRDSLKRLAAKAGVEGSVTPKVLRHSYATHLMERGVDLAVIASLMGHSSVGETGVYLHALPGRCAAAVETINASEEKEG